MGIPKFFRFLGERFCKILQSANDPNSPTTSSPSGVIDNLYLDLNGILHNCAKPDGIRAQKKIDYEKIFLKSFDFIDRIMTTVKPRKILFIAVDGVPPAAKISQQRQRRFVSMKEARLEVQNELLSGLIKPIHYNERGLPEDRFDGNAITPGTTFMQLFDEYLRYFIEKKLASSDSLWKRIEIIYSGPGCPGEGEHKIMDYLRTRQNLAVDEHHCVFGLDADLIMLSLLTHCPKFSLLRKIVEFGPRSQTRGGRRHRDPENNDPRSEKFVYLHIPHLFKDVYYCFWGEDGV